MRPLRDVFALVGTALLVGAAMLAVAFAVSPLSLADQWFAFICSTVALFGMVGWSFRHEVIRRKRPVRRGVLIGSFGALLVLHCITLGSVIYVFEPDWRLPEWTTISLVELAILGMTLNAAYNLAAEPGRRPRTSNRA